MSDFHYRKPATKEALIKILEDAVKKDLEIRKILKKKSIKPTVLGTSKILGIHRDTLYSWLKEFNIDFNIITEHLQQQTDKNHSIAKKNTYLIGEALIGEGNEVAHIDLLIGNKDGPVGKAFATGFVNLSIGHTPLLAVIRPNLPPKPHTLILPKVTVKNLDDAAKIFGPAQAAVAKAVADSLEEGIIDEDKAEEWVIICSVFIHPQAKDFRKIYHYNYSATKLALQRAITNYPSIKKILYDKDRAKHPIMGFKVPRLWRPPYIQIALDAPNLDMAKKVLQQLPESDRIIIEAGTPLIKKYGTKAISQLREMAKDMFIVADLKTLDVGKVEVDLAYEVTADAVVAAGIAPTETLNKFIYEAKRLGIYAVVDMLAVENPIKKLEKLKVLPDVIILHRGIDQESGKKLGFEQIKEIRQNFADKKFLIAIAGGITPETAKEALKCGADIIVVGRYITQSRDPRRSVRDFLELTSEMRQDADQFRVHIE